MVMKTNIEALIKLAGINLQDSPTNTAEALLDGLLNLETELAALNAVAEAAKVVTDKAGWVANVNPAHEGNGNRLAKALANLAAIRKQG